jgi:hypothetical protein
MLPVLLTLLQMAQVPAAASPTTTYNGRSNQLQVDAPRLEAEVRIDGELDEPAWRQAALLTGFSQYQPVDGLPAEDSTEVLVWYDQHQMYFGIRAYEAHGAPQGTLGDRDKTFSDDYVHILLDTFKDARRALVFGANPLGVQTDGTMTEGTNQCQGGGNQNCSSLDVTPDFIYQSKGRLTSYGYEIEMRVPFKSLRYQSSKVQDWGIQVIRAVQHSGHEQTWTPARRGANSFLAQSGTLAGLTELKRGLVMDLNPVVTNRVVGVREEAPDAWRYDTSRPELGGNIRWGITSNLSLSGTYRPDFSQVESDAGQVTYDPRQALFFAEKRPFFLEGSEFFRAPNSLIYTRRIVSPVGATKLAGKVGNTEIGFLSAADDQDFSARPDQETPFYNILRVRRDLGESSTVGMLYTDKIDGTNYNRVAGVDGRFVFSKLYTLFFQGAQSFNRANGVATSAPFWDVQFNREGREFGLFTRLNGSHQDFRTAAGFIGRGAIAHGVVRPSVTKYGLRGGKVESWRNEIVLDLTWDYPEFAAGNMADDIKLHFNTNSTWRGGWRVGGSVLVETFKYPPQLYTNYFVEVPASGGAPMDTVPFTGTDRIPNLDFIVNFATPTYKRFDANGWALLGRDENFYEWAPAYIAFATLNLNYRPTEKLRLEGSYVHQQFVRPESKMTVGIQQIPRLKMEYQISRPIFVRLVGQYLSDRHADLIDDSRTGGRLLFRDGEGRFAPIERVDDNGFHGDVLFSYQPNPGTVFFAGYGSTVTEPTAFGFSNFRRMDDGFFIKVSYLLRM